MNSLLFDSSSRSSQMPFLSSSANIPDSILRIQRALQGLLLERRSTSQLLSDADVPVGESTGITAVRVLGTGASADVVEDPEDPRFVLKIPHETERGYRWMEHEVKVVRKINQSPSRPCGHISAKIVDAGSAKNGKFFIRMERMDGEVNPDFVKEYRRAHGLTSDVHAAVAITSVVAEQVLCLWKRFGMFYSDLKPENTLFKRVPNASSPRFSIRLADLGSLTWKGEKGSASWGTAVFIRTFGCPNRDGRPASLLRTQNGVPKCILFLLGVYLSKLIDKEPSDPLYAMSYILMDFIRDGQFNEDHIETLSHLSLVNESNTDIIRDFKRLAKCKGEVSGLKYKRLSNTCIQHIATQIKEATRKVRDRMKNYLRNAAFESKTSKMMVQLLHEDPSKRPKCLGSIRAWQQIRKMILNSPQGQTGEVPATPPRVPKCKTASPDSEDSCPPTVPRPPKRARRRSSDGENKPLNPRRRGKLRRGKPRGRRLPLVSMQ